MNRYQVYLNPDRVLIIDDLAQELDISRSQIFRDVLDRVTLGYEKLLRSAVAIREKNSNPLLKMAGFAKSSTGRVSENIDEIYLKD